MGSNALDLDLSPVLTTTITLCSPTVFASNLWAVSNPDSRFCFTGPPTGAPAVWWRVSSTITGL